MLLSGPDLAFAESGNASASLNPQSANGVIKTTFDKKMLQHGLSAWHESESFYWRSLASEEGPWIFGEDTTGKLLEKSVRCVAAPEMVIGNCKRSSVAQ